MIFTDREQRAIICCLFQLLECQPSDEECEFIENEITRDWSCKNAPFNNKHVDPLVALSYYRLITNYSWVKRGIESNPYDSFDLVKSLPLEKKYEFKWYVKQVVEIGSDTERVNRKVDIAYTLLEKTEVPFMVRGKDWINDDHVGTRTIV